MSKRQSRRLAIAAGAGAGAALVATAPAAAQDFTVTTLSPDGASGSLRAQVDAANGTPGVDRILFQSGLSGSIGLTAGAIGIYGDLQIVGPGAETIAVDGRDEAGIFEIGDLVDPVTVGIAGLTIKDGNVELGVGGAILSDNAALTVTDSVLTDNTAQAGGAIMSSETDLTIEDSILSDNRASYPGGAIYGSGGGSLTIRDSTFSRNNGGLGGAMMTSQQDVLIESSTFSGNRAQQAGGAIAASYSNAPQSLEIENSTFTRNSGGFFGGALAPLPASVGEVTPDLEVRSSTISGNQAFLVGGGISSGFPSASIDNSIVSGNSATYGPDLFSGSYIGSPPPGPGCGCYDETIFDTGFSLIENPADSEINETVPGSNILNQDPSLDRLRDNGGPTETLAIEADSPVVNQGSSPLTTDQRGLTRPVLYPGIANSAAAGANGADMGAFELQYEEPPPPPPPPPPPVVNGPFKILGSTPNPKNGTAVVRVRVPAPGVVKLVGYKRLRTVKKRANAKGVFKFRAKPKGKLKRKLNRRGRARMLVRFHYNPDQGRTLAKAKGFPLFKGLKGARASVAESFGEWRRLDAWQGD